MKSGKKSVKMNALLSTIQTLMKILFPLISFPYASRILGVEQIGKYNFSFSIVSYFVLIAGLGINTYAVREGAKYRDNACKISQFADEVFSINVISTIVSYVLLILSVFIVNKLRMYSELIGIFSLQILFTTLGRSWLYTIYEEYFFIAVRTTVFQFVSLILLFICVRTSADIVPYVCITTMALVGNEIINMICSQKYCPIHFRLNINKSHIKPILIIFSTAISITIYQSSDMTMLGFFGNDYYVGLYSVSVKIYNIIKQVIAAILIVTIPRFSYYLGKKQIAEYRSLLEKVFNTLLFICIPATTGLFMLSRECIILVSGTPFVEASVSLQFLSIALVFNLVGYMLGYCVLIPKGKEDIFFRATLISAITNIGLNFLLIPYYMQNAAAFTTLVAEAITTLICLKHCKDELSSGGVIKNLVCVISGCVAIMIVCFITKLLIPINIVLTIFSAISCSGIAYLVTQLLLKNQLCTELIISVVHRVKVWGGRQ